MKRHQSSPLKQSPLFPFISSGTIPHMYKALKADLMRHSCPAPTFLFWVSIISSILTSFSELPYLSPFVS